ncbi:hypothetical protein MMC13_003587 [Lambiella insularis]|nr:hypothetical protein [Lambiella insularis]
MSSDLWTAFAGQSKDLSHNPWAESSEDVPAQPMRSHHSSELHASIPKSFHRRNSAASNEPQGTQDLEQRYESLTLDDQWRTAHSQQQHIWRERGFESSSSDTPHPSAHGITPSGQAIVQDQFQLRREEDDFREFEEPEAPPSSTDLRARPSTKPTTLPHNSDEPVSVARQEQSKHTTSIGLEHDPWADVEFQAKQRLPGFVVQADKPDLAVEREQPVPTKEPQYQTQTIETSSDADEWGEFSPDPKDLPQFTATRNPSQQELGSKSSANQAAVHSRSRSEPSITPPSAPFCSKPISSRLYSATPPTNVPPPSILISLVSNLVQKLPAQVTKVMAQTTPAKQTPKALEKALRRCLASLRVAARILAGRKLRWKRDTHLAQSMRIGPAAAGKAGGMKLTGVDKAETQREDREAAELVRVWKQHVGSIRAALASVNGVVDGQPLTLPDISEHMLVRTAKAAQGGIAAPKSCFLCGIKRDERVASIDTDVLDSFGEWWAEHWGHLECGAFWEDHEQFLQSRG